MTEPKPVLDLDRKPKPTRTVRLSQEAHETLAQLATSEQTSMTALVEYAIRRLEREVHFKRIRASYAAMTPEEREAEQEEFRAWQDMPASPPTK